MTEDAVALAAEAVSNRHVSVVKEKAKEILEALQVRARALSPCARVRIGRSATHNCVYPEPQTKVHTEDWGTWGWECDPLHSQGAPQLTHAVEGQPLTKDGSMLHAVGAGRSWHELLRHFAVLSNVLKCQVCRC